MPPIRLGRTSRSDAYLALITTILIICIYVIYVNEVEYINVYRAVSGLEIGVDGVRVVNESSGVRIYVTVLVTNPSSLDVAVRDISGHVRLDGTYIGPVKFLEVPEYIGAESLNVSLVGVCDVPANLADYVMNKHVRGVWTVYGWGRFSVKGQEIMLEYRGSVRSV